MVVFLGLVIGMVMVVVRCLVVLFSWLVQVSAWVRFLWVNVWLKSIRLSRLYRFRYCLVWCSVGLGWERNA